MKKSKTKNSAYNSARSVIVGVSVCALVGAVFMAIGIYFLVNAIGFRMSCTEKVSAVVYTILTAESEDSDTGATTTVYCPVFSFEYGGESYTVNKDYYTSPCDYTLGETAALHINPDNPNEFYAEKDSASTLVPILCTGAGGFALAAAAVILYTFIKKRKARNLDVR